LMWAQGFLLESIEYYITSPDQFYFFKLK
jgi:hypothetical protein